MIIYIDGNHDSTADVKMTISCWTPI